MSKVFADMSMSLDGFIAGPNDSVELPLGAGGERLHQWVYDLASWRESHNMTGGCQQQDAKHPAYDTIGQQHLPQRE